MLCFCLYSFSSLRLRCLSRSVRGCFSRVVRRRRTNLDTGRCCSTIRRNFTRALSSLVTSDEEKLKKKKKNEEEEEEGQLSNE